MSMPGLTKNILRMVGKVLNIIVLIILLINNFQLYNEIFNLSLIFILIGVLFLAIQFYITKDFWDDNRRILMAIIILGTFIPSIYEIIKIQYLFILIVISEYMLVFVEHYSLSIYKKEKKIFMSFSIIIEILLTIYQIIMDQFIVLLLIGQIILLIGLVLILKIESMLKKQKLLNYI